MSVLSGLAGATGRIGLKNSVGNAHAAAFRGLSFAADGSLRFAQTAQAGFSGVSVDGAGAVRTVTVGAEAAPITYLAGLPMDAQGRLLFAGAAGGVPARFDQGVGFAADGGIAWTDNG